MKLLWHSVHELSVTQGVGDWHDLWPWPLTYWPEYRWGSSTHRDVSTNQVWSFWGKVFLSYQLKDVKRNRPTDLCRAILVCPSFFEGGHKKFINSFTKYANKGVSSFFLSMSLFWHLQSKALIRDHLVCLPFFCQAKPLFYLKASCHVVFFDQWPYWSNLSTTYTVYPLVDL